MNRHAGRLAITLMVLLTACGAPQQRTTRLLNERLQTQLARQVAAGQVVVQQMPVGSRVTLLSPSLFPNDARSLDDQFPDVRADVIESLLDPSLMRVQFADTSAMPTAQRDLRVYNVEQYFAANGLGAVLVFGDAAATTTGPAGLVIDIGVQCPPPNHRAGYSDGKPHPVCE
jgi:hypothetical protein